MIITDAEKEIMERAEAELKEAGCHNVDKLLIQRGVGLMVTRRTGLSKTQELKNAKRFIEECLGT